MHHSVIHRRITFVQGKIDKERPRCAAVVGIQSDNVERSWELIEPIGANCPPRPLQILPLMYPILDDIL